MEDFKKENAQFREDLKKVSQVLIRAQNTWYFFGTTKIQARRAAKEEVIEYYLTTELFVSKRLVMVIT